MASYVALNLNINYTKSVDYMAKKENTAFDLDKILTECPNITWDKICLLLNSDLSKVKSKKDLEKLLKEEK